MRVIEPQKFPKPSSRKRQKRRPGKLIWLAITALVVGAGLFFIFSRQKNSISVVDTQPPSQTQEEVEALETEEKKTGPRQFSGNEFRLLYENTLLPNTERVELPPTITGNDVADARIRKIAESRGYRLRRNPSTALETVDGQQLQSLVHQPWLDLKKEAAANGLTMAVVSGFRNVDEQRQLFVSRLQAEGVTVTDVESGNADAEIDKVLVTTSIPGYSRHHTGYVLDIHCAGWAFEDFKHSACHDWLVANNFEQAKKFGFIPSYPDDADLQGPDPEAWEYIYVGSDLLHY